MRIWPCEGNFQTFCHQLSSLKSATYAQISVLSITLAIYWSLVIGKVSAFYVFNFWQYEVHTGNTPRQVKLIGGVIRKWCDMLFENYIGSVNYTPVVQLSCHVNFYFLLSGNITDPSMFQLKTICRSWNYGKWVISASLANHVCQKSSSCEGLI